MTITVENNSSASIECDSETHSLLMDLILGKEIPSRGNKEGTTIFLTTHNMEPTLEKIFLALTGRELQ